MLIDSHCHLDFPDYRQDLHHVVARARQAGVGCMLTISTHVSTCAHVLTIAEQYDEIYCTVGIHPHEVKREAPISVEQLLNLAKHPKVVGFGETGLDYYHTRSQNDNQKQSFRVHITAARQANLPVIIHSRDADGDMASILQEEMARRPFTGILHCFSSGSALAALAVRLGLFVSFSGIITFRNAAALGEVVRRLPLQSILIETDAPFLAPMPFRGQRNEPAFIVHTAERVSALKNSTLDEISCVTTNTFLNLFKKIDRVHLENIFLKKLLLKKNVP